MKLRMTTSGNRSAAGILGLRAVTALTSAAGEVGEAGCEVGERRVVVLAVFDGFAGVLMAFVFGVSLDTDCDLE